MGYDLSLLSDAGLDTKTGLSYTGGAEKYFSAVQRFFNNFEKNRSKLESCYRDKDLENYMITVHALKSNSRMIGATGLGDEFEALENAARDRDSNTIFQRHTGMLCSYETLIEKLRPIGEMESVSLPDEISAAEAQSIANDLLAALDDFDDERSKALVRSLSGYPFRISQKEKLNTAASLIDDFLYDDASDIIKDIYPSIE